MAVRPAHPAGLTLAVRIAFHTLLDQLSKSRIKFRRGLEEGPYLFGRETIVREVHVENAKEVPCAQEEIGEFSKRQRQLRTPFCLTGEGIAFVLVNDLITNFILDATCIHARHVAR